MTTDQRAVFNAAYRIGAALGRKFEVADLTTELRQAAHLFAATYEGDFDYMVQMRDSVTAGAMFFSDGQSKGILNCLMAEAKRRLGDRPKVAAPAATAPQHMYLETLPDGRYRVTLADGESIALYIKLAGTDSKLSGSRVISTRVNGDEWMGVAHITATGNLKTWRSCQGPLLVRVIAALDVLDQAKTQDEWLVAGLAFAQEGSQCFICGRDLDTPESLTAGYGPTCADKHGLPWGAKLSPPRIDPETGVQESAAELLDLVAATRPAPRSITQARAEGRPRTYEELFPEDR